MHKESVDQSTRRTAKPRSRMDLHLSTRQKAFFYTLLILSCTELGPTGVVGTGGRRLARPQGGCDAIAQSAVRLRCIALGVTAPLPSAVTPVAVLGRTSAKWRSFRALLLPPKPRHRFSRKKLNKINLPPLRCITTPPLSTQNKFLD